jgi:hypothetical protein
MVLKAENDHRETTTIGMYTEACSILFCGVSTVTGSYPVFGIIFLHAVNTNLCQ